jgi:hypothetical protein
VPLLLYHFLRVIPDVLRLIHTPSDDVAGTKLFDDLVEDFIAPRRRNLSSSICDLTNYGMQQVILPLAVEGGVFMDLPCKHRQANTVFSTLPSLALCYPDALPLPPFLRLPSGECDLHTEL